MIEVHYAGTIVDCIFRAIDGFANNFTLGSLVYVNKLRVTPTIWNYKC